MDIGTAKLTPPRGVKQWLVDVVTPDQRFTLKRYQRLAWRAIRDIHRRGKLPILVGGTGLYVDAVVRNWRLPAAPARHLRRELDQVLRERGLGPLVQQLRALDPTAARRLDLRNPRRVLRALEVARTAGDAAVVMRRAGPPRYRVLTVSLEVPRDVLRRRLERRARQMLRAGLVRETARLRRRYPSTAPAMSALEYVVVGRYLAGELTRAELPQALATKSWQYARRQLTWWRRDAGVCRVRSGAAAVRLVADWLRAA
jgi:tRNA dimethylallyltransferase